jgi:hypothetical protein
MNVLSLEDSLQLLAPETDNSNTTTTTTTSNKKSGKTIKSPVRINNIEDDFQDLYGEETMEISINEEKYNIETPRTPTREKIDLDDISSVYDFLKEYRYTVLKYIRNKESNDILYVLSFDPNGQVIFVKLNKKYKNKKKDYKIIDVFPQKQSLINNSFKNAIRERIPQELSGIVLFDGIEYNIMLRDDSGELNEYYYRLFKEVEETQNLPETYIVLNIEDIKKDAEEILQISKTGYQVIQNQQLMTNKETLNGIIQSVNTLSETLQKFETTYKNFTKNTTHDWSILSSYSKEYYKKYVDGNLKEGEKEKYDRVSANMFLRFQTFNNQINNIDNMFPIKKIVDEATNKINQTTKKIIEKDNNVSGNVFNVDEINIYM